MMARAGAVVAVAAAVVLLLAVVRVALMMEAAAVIAAPADEAKHAMLSSSQAPGESVRVAAAVGSMACSQGVWGEW